MKLSPRTIGVLISLALLSQSGCVVVGVLLGAVEPVVAGKEKRVALYNGTLQNFHKSVVWGSPERAITNVSSEAQGTFYQELQGRNAKQRLISIQAENTEFSEDAFKATTRVEIRSYGEPTFAVESRYVIEEWEYSRLSAGWMLTGVKADSGTSNEPKLIEARGANEIAPTRDSGQVRTQMR